MERKLTLTALIDAFIVEMERLGYSKSLIRHVKKDCRWFLEYVLETTNQDIFSEEIGARYLSEKFNYPAHYPVRTPDRVLEAVRCVRRLGEMQLFGAFRRQWSSQKESDWYLQDRLIVNAYLNGVQTADHRESTRALRKRNIKRFYDFMGFRGLSGVSDLSAIIISDYTLSLQGCATTSVQHMLSTLKNYFRFLFRNSYCAKDWSSSVPKVSVKQNQTIPALWEKSEVELLMKSIDRTNPVGKRDYAVILLVVQLGLRRSDIAGLKLESLKWDRNEIDLVQHKTGKRLIHPLCEDVGWAIIDYLRYARPTVESDSVFLTSNAPYRKLEPTSVSSILTKYTRLCGITKPSGTTKGVHSLRHGFARRLLEQGTPLPEVSDIMGHISYSSTTPYLKIDVEGLRKCTLSLPEVMKFE
jgi:site-specific recombinase XerD